MFNKRVEQELTDCAIEAMKSIQDFLEIGLYTNEAKLFFVEAIQARIDYEVKKLK